MTTSGIVAIALVGALSATTLAQPPPAPPLRGILVRAAAYVQRFETNFALAIGDEDYEQVVLINAPSAGLYMAPVVRRVMRSEILFVWLPHEQLWLAARNARVVDGKPVEESAGLFAAALAGSDQERQARLTRIRDDSARFNLGEIRRNFNDPTFPLQFLSTRLQRRFRWDLKGRDVVNGSSAWRIDFEERALPTLIRRDNVNLPSRGSVWVHATTSAVVKTTLEVTDEALQTRGSMEVDYRDEPKLALWAPARMAEVYRQLRATARGSGTMREERVSCVATYSNYRRFDTEVRVLP